MNKSLIIGSVLGAVGVTAGGAAGISMLGSNSGYAEVTGVKPVTTIVSTPRQVCHEEIVTHVEQPKDPNRITGSVIGAVVGAAVGNQVGGGSGKKIATVAGAAAGGYAGNKVQQNMQNKNTYTTTEQRCETVSERHEKVIGYDVSYTWKGQQDAVRLDYDPGKRIPVENGELVLTRNEEAAK